MTSGCKPDELKGVSPDDRKQSKLFLDKAREIGANEEQSAADELLGRLAKMKPEPRKKTQIK